jgi:hypothetical protein
LYCCTSKTSTLSTCRRALSVATICAFVYICIHRHRHHLCVCIYMYTCLCLCVCVCVFAYICIPVGARCLLPPSCFTSSTVQILTPRLVANRDTHAEYLKARVICCHHLCVCIHMYVCLCLCVCVCVLVYICIPVGARCQLPPSAAALLALSPCAG